MRELPFVASFDVALCLFMSFGYYDDEDNERTFRSMVRSLVPGGKLVLETWNPLTLVMMNGAKNWWSSSEGIYLAQVEFDALNYVIRDMREVIARTTGKSRTWVRSVRLYTPPELVRIARASGAELIESFGDYDFLPFEPTSPSLITIWRRADP
jgi:SAM-dependent methyltransferase